MNYQQQQLEQKNRRKGLMLAFWIHAGVVVAAMIPLLSTTFADTEETKLAENTTYVTFDFTQKKTDFDLSGRRTKVAAGPKKPAEARPAEVIPKPTDHQPEQAAEPDVQEQVITTPDPVQPIKITIPPIRPSIGTASKPDPRPAPVPPTPAPVASKPDPKPSAGEPSKGPVTGTSSGNGTASNSGSNGGDNSNVSGTGGDAAGAFNGIGGRRVLARPDMRERSNKEGKVSVDVCVNRQGVVESVRYRSKGSTTADPALVKKAEEYAWKFRYEASATAPATQCSYLTFVFRLK